jgi:hypothetical protein
VRESGDAYGAGWGAHAAARILGHTPGIASAQNPQAGLPDPERAPAPRRRAVAAGEHGAVQARGDRPVPLLPPQAVHGPAPAPLIPPHLEPSRGLARSHGESSSWAVHRWERAALIFGLGGPTNHPTGPPTYCPSTVAERPGGGHVRGCLRRPVSPSTSVEPHWPALCRTECHTGHTGRRCAVLSAAARVSGRTTGRYGAWTRASSTPRTQRCERWARGWSKYAVGYDSHRAANAHCSEAAPTANQPTVLCLHVCCGLADPRTAATPPGVRLRPLKEWSQHANQPCWTPQHGWFAGFRCSARLRLIMSLMHYHGGGWTHCHSGIPAVRAPTAEAGR